jgi:hypothetical protein
MKPPVGLVTFRRQREMISRGISATDRRKLGELQGIMGD